MASINSTRLKGCPVLLPSGNEQRAIIEVVANHDQMEEAEQRGLSKRVHLKSGLADDLLAGRVRVPPPDDSAP